MNAWVGAPGFLQSQTLGCVLQKARRTERAARSGQFLQSTAGASSVLHSPPFNAPPRSIRESLRRPAIVHFAAIVSSQASSRHFSSGATCQPLRSSFFNVLRYESSQQSWLRNGFLGAGLAAVGAAALIAGALRSDAAECERADSQAGTTQDTKSFWKAT